jgi:hypothetical protein
VDIYHRVSACSYTTQLGYSVSGRGRHLKRYSVILLTLRYVFALLHNALTLLRSVIASFTYRSGHMGAVVASYSYCSKLIDQRYRFYSLSLLFIIAFPLLCTCFSLIPVSKFFPQNSLFIHVTCALKTRFSRKSHLHLALRYSDNVTLHFAEPYNA